MRNAAMCTNVKCTYTKIPIELQLAINPIVNSNTALFNNQIEVKLALQTTISVDAGKAFQVEIHELRNNYADAFVKPSKPVPHKSSHYIDLFNSTLKKLYIIDSNIQVKINYQKSFG